MVLMLQVIDCIPHLRQIHVLYIKKINKWCLSVKNIQKRGVVIRLLMPSSFYDILVSKYNFNIIQGFI